MSTKNTPTLIILMGPTAVGKTKIAIELALWLDTTIISADSRQFYKEMKIGTAKPTPLEQERVQHHLIDFLSVKQNYDVKQFEEDALAILSDIFKQKNVAMACGGSGLFVKTLIEGIDEMPDISPQVKAELQYKFEQRGLSSLLQELEQHDPDYYSQVDIHNHRRILRALEVFYSTGKPFSTFRRQQDNIAQRPFNIIKVGLYRDRDELYQRINLRVDEMIDAGLFEEVKSLYPYRHQNALHTVGYQEIFPYLDQQYDAQEAIRLIKRNTRRFAKRQLTWFRKDPDIQWFELSGRENIAILEMKDYLTQRLNQSA